MCRFVKQLSTESPVSLHCKQVYMIDTRAPTERQGCTGCRVAELRSGLLPDLYGELSVPQFLTYKAGVSLVRGWRAPRPHKIQYAQGGGWAQMCTDKHECKYRLKCRSQHLCFWSLWARSRSEAIYRANKVWVGMSSVGRTVA